MTVREKMKMNRDDTNDTNKKNVDKKNVDKKNTNDTDKLIQDALEGSISHYRDYDYDVIKETIIICRNKMKEEEQSREQSSSSRHCQQSSNWSVVYKACCRLMARYVIDMSDDKIIEEFNLLN